MEAGLDSLGMAVIGIAIVIAACAAIYLRRQKPSATSAEKARQIVLVIIVAALAAAAGTFGAHFLDEPSDKAESDRMLERVRQLLISLTSSKSDTDRLIEQIGQLPLIGLVLGEHPELEPRFRAAFEAERKSATKGGLSPAFLLMGDVRKQYVMPALRNSDDTHALAAVKVESELVDHLQATNPETCREFGLTGIQRTDKLDPVAAEIFKRTLAAQEDAYRNGKSASADRPAVKDTDVTQLLGQSGYTQADFQQLSKIMTLSAAEACAVTVKLYAAPEHLPPFQGPVVARYLLTAAQ